MKIQDTSKNILLIGILISFSNSIFERTITQQVKVKKIH